MEKPSLRNQRKRRHKSEFFTPAITESRRSKPKRLTCMRAAEFLQIEESQTAVANFLIEHILTKVFDSLNRAKLISQVCISSVDQKAKLLESYEMYTMIEMPQEFDRQICLEEEPKMQSNYKVRAKKDKRQQSNQGNDLLINQLKKMNPSNSKGKLYSKQKLSKVTNTHLAPSASNKSLKSVKSSMGNHNSFAIYRIPKIIEEEVQKEKEKDRKLKEQTIKKLLKEHQMKLKENPHPCPEPLLFQYRSFFTQLETKEEENLRSSYLQLKQLRTAQEKLNMRKTDKRIMSKKLISPEVSEKSISNSVHLPKINNPDFKIKEQKNVSLFTQDDNGKIIRVKNNQKIEARQHSITTHENYIKPRETALKEISNLYKPKKEYLKNDNIKAESTLLHENLSIVSTVYHSMDEQILDKSIMENFPQKKGVHMKRSSFSHKSESYVQLSGLKFPSIMMKK